MFFQILVIAETIKFAKVLKNEVKMREDGVHCTVAIKVLNVLALIYSSPVCVRFRIILGWFLRASETKWVRIVPANLTRFLDTRRA